MKRLAGNCEAFFAHLSGVKWQSVVWEISMIDAIFDSIVTAAMSELLDARNSSDARRKQQSIAQIKKVVDALRTIYFYPKGVMRVLESLASGIRPTQEEIVQVLPEFNDAETLIYRSLKELDPVKGFPKNLLTLRATRLLQQIVEGKMNVRSKSQKLLNHALTFNKDISTNSVRNLILEINDINYKIESVEEALVDILRTTVP
jgi:hypothetical protein